MGLRQEVAFLKEENEMLSLELEKCKDGLYQSAKEGQMELQLAQAMRENEVLAKHAQVFQFEEAVKRIIQEFNKPKPVVSTIPPQEPHKKWLMTRTIKPEPCNYNFVMITKMENDHEKPCECCITEFCDCGDSLDCSGCTNYYGESCPECICICCAKFPHG